MERFASTSIPLLIYDIKFVKILVFGCAKAGFTLKEYHDDMYFLHLAKESLGVNIFMDIKAAPSSGKIIFLAEIKVARRETHRGMRRIDHPGATYVKKGPIFVN